MSEFLLEHRQIRRQMHQATLPLDNDMFNTVRFIVYGLGVNSQYRDQSRPLSLTGLP